MEKYKLDLQMFAEQTFDPDNVTMMNAKTGKVPTNIHDEILTGVKTGSGLMALAKEVPMTKPIETFTHMSGVGAYWVSETERIQTSKPTFLQTEMRAYKLGVIVPTSKENLQHSVTNFFELVKPEIQEAFARKFDQAGFLGTDSPYAQNILKAATDAGNLVTETKDKYNDIDKAIALLEEEDFEPNGLATTRKQRTKYRQTKDGNGMPIFNTANSNGVDDILGLPIAYLKKASLGDDVAEVVGDWNNVYYGILRGIEYDILTEATLTTMKDAEGNDVSLAERDMVALKATMQIGFMVVKDDAFAVVNAGK